MRNSVGSLEFKSISKGIEVSNEIFKNYDLDIIYAKSVCPGKFLVIFSGDSESINNAIDFAINMSDNYLIENFIIHKVHKKLIDALKTSSFNKNIDGKCFGVVETLKICTGLKALDYILKYNDVDIFKLQLGFAIGSKLVFLISGNTSDIENAISSIKNNLSSKELLNVAVMSSVCKEFLEKF